MGSRGKWQRSAIRQQRTSSCYEAAAGRKDPAELRHLQLRRRQIGTNVSSLNLVNRDHRCCLFICLTYLFACPGRSKSSQFLFFGFRLKQVNLRSETGLPWSTMGKLETQLLLAEKVVYVTNLNSSL